MFKKILFAADFGPFYRFALEYVSELASRYHARITLIHVLEPVSILSQTLVKEGVEQQLKNIAIKLPTIDPGQTICDGIHDALEADVLRELPNKEMLESVLVSQGRAAEVILRLSSEMEADIIVMGSHGPDALDSRVIGSVTNKVLQLSKIPVLMIPMINSENWRRLAGRRALPL